MPPQISEFIHAVPNHLKFSPTRKSQLLEILQYFELDKHDILKPGDTRWLSLKEYLDGIIEQWPSLLLHFEASLFDKQCEKSRKILALIKDPFKRHF